MAGQELRTCQKGLIIYIPCYVDNIYKNLISWQVKTVARQIIT